MIGFVILAIIQLIAIIAHGYILILYRDCCGHCYWWSDFGALIFFGLTFIPIVGIFAYMLGLVDYIRNIAERLGEGD